MSFECSTRTDINSVCSSRCRFLFLRTFKELLRKIEKLIPRTIISVVLYVHIVRVGRSVVKKRFFKILVSPFWKEECNYFFSNRNVNMIIPVHFCSLKRVFTSIVNVLISRVFNLVRETLFTSLILELIFKIFRLRKKSFLLFGKNYE